MYKRGLMLALCKGVHILQIEIENLKGTSMGLEALQS